MRHLDYLGSKGGSSEEEDKLQEDRQDDCGRRAKDSRQQFRLGGLYALI